MGNLTLQGLALDGLVGAGIGVGPHLAVKTEGEQHGSTTHYQLLKNPQK